MKKYRIRKYADGPRRLFRSWDGRRVQEDFEEDLDLWTPAVPNWFGRTWAFGVATVAAGAVAYLIPAVAEVTMLGVAALAVVGGYQRFKRQGQNQTG